MLYGAFAVTLLATTAVVAQPSSGETKSSANKQICRAVADTGSRLGRSRICHTAEEWAELRRETQQNIDRVQNARPMNGN
jgi:hypothetical protein